MEDPPPAHDGAETMESVVELNHWRQAEIQNTCHYLPQHLYHTYYTKVSAPLRDQNNGITVELLLEVNS